MAPSKLKQRLGTYISSSVAGETVRAFIPPPLPPVPELQLKELHQHLDRANQELGRLNGMTKLLPDIRFLFYLYTRKEALVSSQIEGTQSSNDATIRAVSMSALQGLACYWSFPVLQRGEDEVNIGRTSFDHPARTSTDSPTPLTA